MMRGDKPMVTIGEAANGNLPGMSGVRGFTQRSGQGSARRENSQTWRKFNAQFPTAITRLCVLLTPPSVNATGTLSLAAMFGTTTLN